MCTVYIPCHTSKHWSGEGSAEDDVPPLGLEHVLLERIAALEAQVVDRHGLVAKINRQQAGDNTSGKPKMGSNNFEIRQNSPFWDLGFLMFYCLLASFSQF